MENNGEPEKKASGNDVERLSPTMVTSRKLKRELDTANDLIKTMRNKGLTEDDVEWLSPSAAAKSGIILTQIYS